MDKGLLYRTYTQIIKQKALELGFDACGIALAEYLNAQRDRLTAWLVEGYHAKMSYMANHLEKRIDPRLLVPGAQSVVVVALNYYPGISQPAGANYKIARYAYGRDYHPVMKEKLQQLADHLTHIAGKHIFRIFTDSAPVLERAWAQQSGLGNYGKNACLIIPRKGSYFFLGELITSLKLEPDEAFQKDLCGKCTRCIEACPTQAIKAPGIIDSRKCISYLTIELKENMPEHYRGKCEGWIFGCDICQEACPHNQHAQTHNEPAFEPSTPIVSWHQTDWESLTKEGYTRYFKKGNSAIARVKYEKLMDNIRATGASNQ